MTHSNISASEKFRANFPALEQLSWLDTPGSPPGARPVIEAVRNALTSWEDGSFSWVEWDESVNIAREKLAILAETSPECIALVGSLSEAAAIVAAAVPASGKIVVASDDFRSNLFPWLAQTSRGVEIVTPPEGGTATLTERILSVVVPGIDLVAISSAVSSTGARPDYAKIIKHAHQVGARVFLNVTQSFGVYQHHLSELNADYVAAHAYKWMLAPRGCAWLSVRPDRLSELEPLAPGWHSVHHPNQSYVGSEPFSPDARRLDGGLAWLPWIGGIAALDVLLSLDFDQLGEHVFSLVSRTRAGLESLGLSLEEIDQPSQIIRIYSDMSPQIVTNLKRAGVKTSGGDTSFRIGIHGFNSEQDIDRFLNSVRETVQSIGG